jgi:2,3-bisphosphoglycerate-independent phosphoglycerate mutase
VAYRSTPPINTLSSFLSVKGMHQLKVAETEKYAHVTFFFNGGIEEPYLNEDRVLVPSPKVPTYDLKPEMSAYGVKEEVLKRLKMDKYDLIVVNFANPDMVGHTAIIPAVIKAVETADICLGEILEVLKEKNGKALITADHGNAEKLIDEETGGPFTAHTTNKVPLIFFGEDKVTLEEGKLADIAPTLLDMMGLEAPDEMTGETLIIDN